jgi:hypothetical protein
MSGMMQELAIIRMGDEDDDGGDTSVITKVKPKTKRPPLYKVMLLNDDYTPMEFVVHVLERFFGMDHAQAFEGDTGYGPCTPAPAPAAMHDGKGVRRGLALKGLF